MGHCQLHTPHPFAVALLSMAHIDTQLLGIYMLPLTCAWYYSYLFSLSTVVLLS